VKLLFIHPNFPSQFVHLAAALGRERAHTVVALSQHVSPVPPGVTLRRYGLLRQPAGSIDPIVAEHERSVMHAQACAVAALKLKNEGFTPDVIVAHPGWGDALFIKDVFPQARLVVYCEYYYSGTSQDAGFDPELPPLTLEQRCLVRMRNTASLLSMELADAAIAPTAWQKSTYPAWARDKISVIHDGIDLARLRQPADASLVLAAQDGRPAARFTAGDEVLTYVARNLEPVRGFQVFMRMLPPVLARRPKAHAIIVGGDQLSYSPAAPGGASWKQRMLAEVGDQLDLRRVHFTGVLPHQQYVGVLNVSKAHAYWTTPFVLSWSFLEAAASGVALLASDTEPVREFAPALGVATLPFYDAPAFSAALAAQLAAPAAPRRPPDMHELDIGPCTAARMRLIASLA
jgi:glycosyltransferase involved in cell wall biosynthesis